MGRDLINTLDTALTVTLALVIPVRFFHILQDREIIVAAGFAFVAALCATWAVLTAPRRV